MMRLRSPVIAICKLETQESWCVILPESEGLRTKGASDVNPSPSTGEDEMSQFKH